MKKIGLFILNALVTIIGGWILAHIIVAMSGNMPEWMDSSLRAVLHVVGQDDLAKPDDLPALGMIAVLIASLVVCGLVVWAANATIARVRTRKAHA